MFLPDFLQLLVYARIILFYCLTSMGCTSVYKIFIDSVCKNN